MKAKRNLNRREFLEVSALGALGARGAASAAVTDTDARPNILVILTDQQCADTMSCAGNADLKTPAMDRLAEQGVRFANAYCANPLCVPSRTAMMTGRMPHETGIRNNQDGRTASFDTPVLGRFFTDAGYECGYAGKWHLPPKESQSDVHGFTWFPEGNERRADAGISEAVEQFLERQRTRPFLMVASFVNPHDICQWARGDRLPHGSIPDPPDPARCPALPSNFAIPEHEPEVLRKVWRASKSVYPSVDWSPDKWRQYRWAYCRLVEKVDAQVGQVLDALKNAGREDDTLIVFTSDHGDGNAAHHWNQKQALYEEPARVPFIVSGKRFAKPNGVDREHLVSTGLDLIPTLCDYAGIAVPDGLRGRSVRPLAQGEEVHDWRDAVVSETEFEYEKTVTGILGRMLRTQRHKYIVYSEGALREQLFDMADDPGEMNNLAVDPASKPILDACRNRLAQWERETSDTFEIPAGES